MPFASSDRGAGRPVRRRTRTFRPNYLSFAGTYQCNLSCAHCCVPIEWPDRLEIPVALRFLEDAHASGIKVLGFTGGEPFLYPEFLLALSRRAAALGFRFDKIVTNGVWFEDEARLTSILRRLKRAGYTGKLGLSVDKFHGSHTPAFTTFCKTARKVFGRDNILSLSYASRRPDQGLAPVHALARELDAVVSWSELLGRYLLVSPELTMTLNWNHLAPVERAERLTGAWDGEWFEEDYCEGPGQALIVNPKGEVKPCCGFASDLDQLTIGNIHTDTVAQVVRRARAHPYVGKVFREGLTAIRDEILRRDPAALPEATSNHCYFCWYALTRNLTGLDTKRASDAGHERLSLPVTTAPAPGDPHETETSLRFLFDGKQVLISSTAAALGAPLRGGRSYELNIRGPAAVALPPEPLSWTEYQSWINQLRIEGYHLSSSWFPSCAGAH